MQICKVWEVQTKQDIHKEMKIPLFFFFFLFSPRKVEKVQILPCIGESSEKHVIATTVLSECK